jgi:WD40 repeat protein
VKLPDHAGGGGGRFSPDSKHFLTFTQKDRIVRLWDATTLKQVRSWEYPVGGLRGWVCDFLPDGRQLVTFEPDLMVRWLDVKTGTEVKSLKIVVERLNGGGLSPDGRRLIYSSLAENAVYVVELPSGKEIARFAVAAVPFGRLSISPDGRYAAGASAEGWVYLWSLPNPPNTKDKP